LKPTVQALLIGLVIILILSGEAAVYVPRISTGRSVTIESFGSTADLLQALSSGEIDVAPLDTIAPQSVIQIKNDPNLNIVQVGNFGFTYIGLNLRNAPLSNPVFRQAMLYGFNRERVLEAVLGGYGETLSPGLFSSAYAKLGWRNDSVSSFPYDPVKASQLLASIGFTRNSSGILTDPSTGQNLRTMFIISRLSDPQGVSAANYFAQDMQAIGIPVVSFPQTDIDFKSYEIAYAFDLFVDTESGGFAPTWLYSLFASANDISPAPLSTNLVGYHNSTFEAYSNQLMNASDSTSAKIAALNCQGELSVDLPVIPIYSKNSLIVERKGAINITPVTGSVTDTLATSLTNATGTSLLRIGEVGGLTDINPALALTPADSLALRLITDPLLASATNGLPQPALVDEWQTHNNATSLILKLRPDSHFQDGTAITSHDLAATLHWVITNMIPSTELYPTLSTIKSITELDDHTLTISLDSANYFAPLEIGNMFALPANSLPKNNGELALLLNGALKSSGPFSLTRYVQGIEVDLQQVSLTSGSVIGGDLIQIRSVPLYYDGQPIENATFTVRVQEGGSTSLIQGSSLGFGIYGASLNLNGQTLTVGSHTAITQLYAQLPSGALIQFSEQTITVQPSLLIWQLVLYSLAVGLTLFLILVAPSSSRPAGKRGRVRRKVTVGGAKKRHRS
jgi:ABC-type transport system substrate-binding protein